MKLPDGKETMRPITEVLTDGEWEGCPCFILGGGDSWRGFDLKRLPEDAKTLGVNMAWFMEPDLNYCSDGDALAILKDAPGWGKTRTISVSHEGNQWDPAGGHYIKILRTPKTRIEDMWGTSLAGGINVQNNSGAAAIALADLLRPRAIYLLGFDLIEDRNGYLPNWHSLYPGSKKAKRVAQKFIWPFEQITVKHCQIPIYNTNPHSRLTVFPRITIDQALERCANERALEELRGRRGVPRYLQGLGRPARAAELGVAKGSFSAYLLENTPNLATLYSVDRWSDHHDEREATFCHKLLGRYGGRSRIIRSSFQEALDEVEDRSLDLCYVDGYAATGQEGGQTLRDWVEKVAPGGVICGHDYSEYYKRTLDAVDQFAQERRLRLHITQELSDIGDDRFPSWWAVV